MRIVYGVAVFVVSAAWAFGAVTGRLASMIAAAVNPTWVA